MLSRFVARHDGSFDQPVGINGDPAGRSVAGGPVIRAVSRSISCVTPAGDLGSSGARDCKYQRRKIMPYKQRGEARSTNAWGIPLCYGRAESLDDAPKFIRSVRINTKEAKHMAAEPQQKRRCYLATDKTQIRWRETAKSQTDGLPSCTALLAEYCDRMIGDVKHSVKLKHRGAERLCALNDCTETDGGRSPTNREFSEEIHKIVRYGCSR